MITVYRPLMYSWQQPLFKNKKKYKANKNKTKTNNFLPWLHFVLTFGGGREYSHTFPQKIVG